MVSFKCSTHIFSKPPRVHLIEWLSVKFQRCLNKKCFINKIHTIRRALQLLSAVDVNKQNHNNDVPNSSTEKQWNKYSPWWMNSATWMKSFSLSPLEVRAGVPILKPLGRSALLSPGQVFLFKATLISSRTFSALAPSPLTGRKSTNTKWLSVPPGVKEWYSCKKQLSVQDLLWKITIIKK